MFVDTATVLVRAGAGGSGIVSWRRERYIARGGPDGGDGGSGGSVVFVASNNENTLADFRYQKELTAEDGQNGGAQKRHGKSGQDLIVNVPVGTQLFHNDELIADLVSVDQREVIAEGGKGGFGNAHFTSSVRQAPKIAEKGDPGEEYELRLELKTIADVGLVGLPNTGKSTFLAAVTGARPKIANYPFTTLTPHLGVATVDKGQELLFADIPGLIDGASEGKGLGDEFLRHVERTHVLLHVVDVYASEVVLDYKTIEKELRDYKVDLTQKPRVVALTKIEGLDEDIVEDQRQKLLQLEDVDEVYAISSLSKDGVQPLLYQLQAVVGQQHALHQDEDDAIPIVRAQEDVDRWHVEVVDDYVVVTGPKIERFAKRTDFASEEGVARLRDIMRKLGITKDFERRQIYPNTRIYFGDNREDYMDY